MTTGDYEMPPHLVRYLEAVSGPGKPADPAAAAGDSLPVTITPVFDVDQYLAPIASHGVTPHAAQGRTAGAARLTVPDVADSRPGIQADGHVDPAAAARWHRAQTELVSLIREENRASTGQPDAGRTAALPDELAPWLEQRVAELEQAAAAQPEVG